jgi:hypothetical protein
MKYGAPGEIRTPDRLVRSQVLYPAELRARFLNLLLAIHGDVSDALFSFRSGPVFPDRAFGSCKAMLCVIHSPHPAELRARFLNLLLAINRRCF